MFEPSTPLHMRLHIGTNDLSSPEVVGSDIELMFASNDQSLLLPNIQFAQG